MINRNLLRSLWVLPAVVGIGALFWVNPFDKAPVNLGLGLLLISLAILPLWRWMRNPSVDAVPVIGMMGFFYALCLGLGGLVTSHADKGNVVSESDYTTALIAALVSWGALYSGFAVVRRHASRRTPRLFSDLGVRHDGIALWVGYPISLLADLLVHWLKIGELYQVTYPLHLFFFVWVLHVLWSRRYSVVVSRLVLLIVLPLDVFLYSGLADGKLVQLLIYGQLLGLTYTATTGRIPYVPLVLAAGAFFLLQPVKGEYRLETWYQGAEVDRIEGAAQFVQRGLDYYFDSGGTPLWESIHQSYSRINHLYVTAAVIAETPVVSGFRYGETYMPLLTKWIPRAVWPEKPREELGNRWAHDYHYLSKDDDVTSFNLPWLPEMYMNFGWFGVVLISWLVGALAAFVWSMLAKPHPSPMFAAGLVLLSPFFFPESNLSLGIGGLITGGLTIATFCWAIGSLFPGRLASRELSLR